MNADFVELPIPTRDGTFVARYSEKGLAGLEFPQLNRRGEGNESQISPASKEWLRDSSRRLPLNRIRAWHRATSAALKTILAGRDPEYFPPLDLAGTAFQKSIWNAMRKISPGKTKSYGEIAKAVGRPKAVRAVGGACGANPVPVLVPCHRVLAANQKLGGFGGGLDWKQKLLKREGIELST
jgi:O-6-methylguanine DNA methyltransferase